MTVSTAFPGKVETGFPSGNALNKRTFPGKVETGFPSGNALNNISKKAFVVLLLALAAPLAACSMFSGGEQQYPEKIRGQIDPAPSGERPVGLFGSDGFVLLGGKDEDKSSGPAGIGVNGFLWRASLDTISFMPLLSADPFGGVIITDWYTVLESPNERLKLTVYILDRRLRADGLRVSVFRQELTETGNWLDTPTAPETATQLENQILTRARQMRIASLEAAE